MGLKKSYYKPTEKMLLEDYLKAVPLLAINNINNNKRLAEKIKELTERNQNNELLIKTKLQEKDDALSTLSDQVMKLMAEVAELKSK